jgi:site-specific DNA recombinase
MTTIPQRQRFFVYLRKSTDDKARQVRSIQDQLMEVKELAAREGHVIVKIFEESRTAKTPGRPIFNEMIEALVRGEADGIMAWHPDRLSRNPIDAGCILHHLDTGAIKTLRFVTCWFDNSPQGKFTLAIAFGQSKYYVDSLSQNIIRGKDRKIKDRLWPQMAPTGYLNDPVTKGIKIDEATAEHVRTAFRLYATGKYSLSEIREVLHAAGLVGKTKKRPLSIANVQHMLRNPIYCGIMRYLGELHPGAHEPMVSRELFDKVQEAAKTRRRRSRKQKKYFALRGLLTCEECGCVITAEVQKGHNYYRCTKRKTACSQPYVREEVLSEQMSALLLDCGAPEYWIDAALEELKDEKATTVFDADTRKKSVQTATATLDEKIFRLTEAYASGALSLAEFQIHKNKIVVEKQELTESMNGADRLNQTWFEPAVDFLNTCKQAVKTALTGSIEEKRETLEKVGSNFVLSIRRLTFSTNEAWKTLVPQPFPRNVLALASSSATTISPESDEHSNWRMGRDSNPRGLLRPNPLSRRAHSTTLPPIQIESRAWWPEIFRVQAWSWGN